MISTSVKTTVLAASLLLLVPVAADATTTKQKVRGKLEATADDSEAKGKFWLFAKTRNDRFRETLTVLAKGLDATEDENGDRPEYNVWLVNADGDFEADFGIGKLNARGKFRFRFSSGNTNYPDDVDELRDFGGGTIEVRDGDDVVLDGEIPEFVDIDDDNEEGSGSGARAKDKEKLTAVDEDSKARGAVRARAQNKPKGQREQIVVTVKRLDKGTYTVVVIPEEGDEVELGDIRTFTRLGVGILFLDSRRDDIPGDGVLSMGGDDVEVRDEDGNAVLTGSFPELQ